MEVVEVSKMSGDVVESDTHCIPSREVVKNFVEPQLSRILSGGS